MKIKIMPLLLVIVTVLISSVVLIQSSEINDLKAENNFLCQEVERIKRGRAYYKDAANTDWARFRKRSSIMYDRVRELKQLLKDNGITYKRPPIKDFSKRMNKAEKEYNFFSNKVWSFYQDRNDLFGLLDEFFEVHPDTTLNYNK